MGKQHMPGPKPGIVRASQFLIRFDQPHIESAEAARRKSSHKEKAKKEKKRVSLTICSTI